MRRQERCTPRVQFTTERQDEASTIYHPTSGEGAAKNRMQNIAQSLIDAVRKRRFEKVVELISVFGVRYCKEWLEGYVLLCIAISNRDLKVAKLLVSSGARMNSQSENFDETPLHLAAGYGDNELLEMLLDGGAAIEARNADGCTPIYNAIQNGNIKSTRLLLGRKALVNITNKTGETPLHYAVTSGRNKILNLLLKQEGSVSAVAIHGATLLHIAAAKGYIEIGNILLKYGAYTLSICSSRLVEGFTLLHFAAENCGDEVVRLLLRENADPNATTKDNITPLQMALEAGRQANVIPLLEYGANINAQNKHGKTMLCLAVEKGDLVSVENMLKYSPDINNESNISSLKIAVQSYDDDYVKITESLLLFGFNISTKEINNPSLLHAAVEKGHLTIVEHLLKHGADVDILSNSTYKRSCTLLHSAVKSKQVQMVQLLLNYGAHVNAKDEKSNTPIFYAIQKNDSVITKILLTNGANIKFSTPLLSIAVINECCEIIKILLEYGAEVNDSDNYGRTALHFAAGNFRKVSPIRQSEKESAEIQRAYNTDINIGNEVLTMLLQKGAKLNARQKNEFTALHVAAEIDNADCVKELLKWGADVNCKAIGKTALHIAAGEGCLDTVEFLLKSGADIDGTDDYEGLTALHIACAAGRAEIVTALLKYRADINIISGCNHTALDFAYLSDIPGYYPDEEFNDDFDGGFVNFEVSSRILEQHIIMLHTIGVSVSERNLLPVLYKDVISNIREECATEVNLMKTEKIKNTTVSFYDILTEDIEQLAIHVRNENIIQALSTHDYKSRFPNYANLIEFQFKKSVEKNEILEKARNCFKFLFNDLPELPYVCENKIIRYLDDISLKNVIDACYTPKVR